MEPATPSDLERFVTAQEPVIATVLRELRDGAKRSHWMWFVFPQLLGLGHSEMARRYGLSDAAEALAYLAHPVLGPRLGHCVSLVNAHRGRDVHRIFGSPDDLKFHSSMTLFNAVGPGEAGCAEALNRFFGGRGDPVTLRKLLEP